jgi:sRNA-binding protein
MYLLSVIAGGNRYNLDGDVAGEVTPSEIEYAKKVLAGIDAKKLQAAGEAAANYQRQHEERERPVVRQVKAEPQRKPVKPPPALASSSQQRPPVRHLSRVELAALARARRAGG